MFGKIRGSLFITFASLCFGSYGVFAKYLAEYDIFFQTYVRCFIVAVILLVAGLATKQLKSIKREDIRYWVPLLIATSFSIAPITFAFRNLPLGTVSFLFYSSFTIFTYALGRILFQERLTRVKIVSALLALIGLLVVFTLDLSVLLVVPMLLAIFNGLASSSEVVLSKNLTDKYSSLQVTLMVFVTIGVTHMILSLLLNETQSLSLIVNDGAIIFGFSIAAILGVVSLYAGYREVDASVGSLVGLTEIIFSVLFGILLFQETLSINTVIGGGMILVAAALPNLIELSSQRKRKLLPIGSS